MPTTSGRVILTKLITYERLVPHRFLPQGRQRFIYISRIFWPSLSKSRPLLLPDSMPRPKLFGRFSSKSNNSSESNSVRDAPASDRRGGALQTATVTSDGPVPGYPDSLKEAWTAAHQELPRAQGAEKFLNKIGMSIITFKRSCQLPHPLAAIIDVDLPSSADL